MTSETDTAGLHPVMVELRQIREAMAGFATKADLAEREVRLIRWMFGAMLPQTAVIVGFVVGVVLFLK